MTLTASDFPAFFHAIHGIEPFPWQTRLLDLVATKGEWPPVLALPTGSGKTAVLDIAVFHLALEATRGQERRAPVRIVLVVDRRLIVDEAHERARKIAASLGQLGEAPLLAEVAARLASLAEEGKPPLIARRLRGGVPREDDWARVPSQPTILCSTVDQVGSRLLFRGYGVSDTMKPVHAGLLGSDCLIFLDEAHLSEPFRQTLDWIATYQGAPWRDPGKSAAPWMVSSLSATPGAPKEPPFLLDAEDRRNLKLASRLTAGKPARLIEVSRAQARHPEDQIVEQLVAEAIAGLEALATRGVPNAVLAVVANRVLRARRVFEALSTRLNDAAELDLIIGPARSVDRLGLAARLAPIKTGAPRDFGKPWVIVATQTIEAGVDFDLDGLITEAASLDALRQRFGRVNRAGRCYPAGQPISVFASIVAHRNDIGPKADDPVYGEALAATWRTLTDWGGEEKTVDFGIDAMEARLGALGDGLTHLLTEKADAPVLMPAYVDLFSQTSPIPGADPDVGLFLHGSRSSPEGIGIIWRADVDQSMFSDPESEALIAQALDLVPPMAAEAVEVSISTARRWLALAEPEDIADVAQAEDGEQAPSPGARRPAFRWAGIGSPQTGFVHGNGLRPGDRIIVPVTYGGCDQFGWKPSSTDEVTDVADLAATPFESRRFEVRITKGLIRQGLMQLSDLEPIEHEAIEEETDRLTDRLFRALAVSRELGHRAVLDEVRAIGLPPAIAGRLEALNRAKKRTRVEAAFPYDGEAGVPQGVVFVVHGGLGPLPVGTAAGIAGGEPAVPVGEASTEDDEAGSMPGFDELLEDHSKAVSDLARELARKAGLPSNLVADIATAGYLHDTGKADDRFQAMLYGGNWIDARSDRLLAKSQRRVPGAGAKAGLPSRWRHEALSVRFARNPERLSSVHDPDLVLWIIGVHHGYGRPLFPNADEQVPADMPTVMGGLFAPPGPGPQSLAFDFQGFDWPQLFEKLKRRYGVWELARLEAVLRLADHRASEAAVDREEGLR